MNPRDDSRLFPMLLASASARRRLRAWPQCVSTGAHLRYVRVPRQLGEELVLACAGGSYRTLMQTLTRTELLIFDDWGLNPLGLGDRERRDLLELVEDRVGQRVTPVTRQLRFDRWHDVIGDPTLGGAILDRLVHRALRLTLRGGSLRRQLAAPRTQPFATSPPGDRPQPNQLIALERNRQHPSPTRMIEFGETRVVGFPGLAYISA